MSEQGITNYRLWTMKWLGAVINATWTIFASDACSVPFCSRCPKMSGLCKTKIQENNHQEKGKTSRENMQNNREIKKILLAPDVCSFITPLWKWIKTTDKRRDKERVGVSWCRYCLLIRYDARRPFGVHQTVLASAQKSLWKVLPTYLNTMLIRYFKNGLCSSWATDDSLKAFNQYWRLPWNVFDLVAGLILNKFIIHELFSTQCHIES